MKTKIPSFVSFLIVIAVFLLVYFVSGIRLCAVVSGSMEPNLPTWSLSIVSTRAKYENIQVGDIVVYERESDGKRIIHRVIEITDEGMVTKGDHNRVADEGFTTAENFFGKYLFHVPWLGKLPILIRTPLGYAVIGVVLALLIVTTIADERKAKQQEAAEQAAKAEAGEGKEE